MDGSCFDQWTRSLISRRTALGRLLGGGLLTTLGVQQTSHEVEAAPCRKGKKRCKQRCIPKRQCCTNANCRPAATGKVCKRGRCVCPPTTKLCGPQCIPLDACCGGCPTGHLCQQATCSVATSDGLQAALGPAGPAIIRLGPGTFEGGLTVARNVTIIGAGVNSTILDGGGTARVLKVESGVTAELQDLQVRNGQADAGGGVSNGGTLTLRSCLVTGNRATVSGGGFYNLGTLFLRGTTIVSSNNGGRFGGGIFTGGATSRVEMHDNTLVTDNEVTSFPADGGGIYNYEPEPGSVEFFGDSRVTGNRPDNCDGTSSCPG